MKKRLYYTQIEFNGYTFVLASTEQGLAFVGSPNADLKEVYKFYPDAVLVENEMMNRAASQQIKAYLNGSIHVEIEMVITDVHGTLFQEKVWQALKNVPCGTTRTYQEIANAIGNPKAVRAVGTAVGRNPVTMVIPCHRIVSKNGKGSGFRSGILMKKWLLVHEQAMKNRMGHENLH